MKDLKNFILLPAKVITFLESSKLFVEESKTLPSDFCMKTSVTVTANVQNHCALGVTLVYKDYNSCKSEIHAKNAMVAGVPLYYLCTTSCDKRYPSGTPCVHWQFEGLGYLGRSSRKLYS